MFPPPIFVNHEIIHNRFVVEMFRKKWIIFEQDLGKIPEGSLVVISAHGSGPNYIRQLIDRRMRWIDATCPLVEKVHREAKKFIQEGYHILYIGKRGHQEALGVIDEGEKHFTLIEKKEDLHNYAWAPRLALLTQTTLSVDDTEDIIAAAKLLFPHLVLPKTSDICYATTNRQNAVKALAEYCDSILVVGSKNSSNSNKLKSLAASLGKRASLIDDASEIDREWLVGVSSIWVTSWASGPEELVVGVIERLTELWGGFEKEIRIIEEKMEFPYTITVQNDKK